MRYLFIVVTVAASALFLTLNPGGKGGTAQASVSMDSLPDLVVEYLQGTFESDTACDWQGKPMGTRVWVANIGNAAAGPFAVELRIGANSWQQTLSSGLAAGQWGSVWFPESTYGHSDVLAIVDATSQVTESNESNNTWGPGSVPQPTPPATCTPGPSPTPTRTPAPTQSTGDPVGGIADLPGAATGAAEPAATENDSSRAPYRALAGAAAGIVVLGAGGWYARRRRRAG